MSQLWKRRQSQPFGHVCCWAVSDSLACQLVSMGVASVRQMAISRQWKMLELSPLTVSTRTSCLSIWPSIVSFEAELWVWWQFTNVFDLKILSQLSSFPQNGCQWGVEGALLPLEGWYIPNRISHGFCTHIVRTARKISTFWCIIYACRVKIVRMRAGWTQKFVFKFFMSTGSRRDVTHCSSDCCLLCIFGESHSFLCRKWFFGFLQNLLDFESWKWYRMVDLISSDTVMFVICL